MATVGFVVLGYTCTPLMLCADGLLYIGNARQPATIFPTRKEAVHASRRTLRYAERHALNWGPHRIKRVETP